MFYLLVAVFSVVAVYSTGKAYEPGDGAATRRNVAAHAGLVRAGFVADLVQATCFLFVAMTLYVLFKHVSKAAVRALMMFVAISVTIMCLNAVYQLVALVVATDTSYTGTLGGTESDALVLLMFDLHRYGFLVAQIFFGLWLLPFGYLVYRSGMFPRVLGILLVLGCAGYLIDTFARFLAPDLGAALSPFVLVPPAVAEVAMLLWLLVKGAEPQVVPA